MGLFEEELITSASRLRVKFLTSFLFFPVRVCLPIGSLKTAASSFLGQSSIRRTCTCTLSPSATRILLLQLGNSQLLFYSILGFPIDVRDSLLSPVLGRLQGN